MSDDLTLVRGDHQFAFGANVAHWASLSLANVRSPGQLLIDGSQTGLPLTDFLLGRMGINGLAQAAPNTLDMASDLPRRVRARHVASGPEGDAQLRTSLGAVLPAAVGQRRRLPVRLDEVPAECQEHRLPECTGGALLPGRSGISQPGWHAHAVGESRATRRARLGSGRGRAYGDPGVVREVVRVRERAVPPRHVGRAAVGLRRPDQQPVRGPGQSVCRLGSDQYLPGDVRPERALLVERAVHQSERRHEIHTRPFVEHDRRTADRGAGSLLQGMWEAVRTTSGNRRRSTTPCS